MWELRSYDVIWKHLTFPYLPTSYFLSYLTPNLLVSLAFPFLTTFIYFYCVHMYVHMNVYFYYVSVIYMYTQMCVHGHAHMWRWEKNFWDYVLSFHRAVSRLLTHPASPFIDLSRWDLSIGHVPTCHFQSDTNGEVKSPNHTLVIKEFILQSHRKFMSSDYQVLVEK